MNIAVTSYDEVTGDLTLTRREKDNLNGISVYFMKDYNEDSMKNAKEAYKFAEEKRDRDSKQIVDILFSSGLLA